MKIRYILLAIFATAIFFSACNDDFMDQNPGTDIAEETMFAKESDLRFFLDALYGEYITGHEEGVASSTYGPDQIRGSRIINGDALSDNVVGVSQVAGDGGINPVERLTMRMLTPEAGESTGWEWKKLRYVNFFLKHYREVPIDEKKLNSYAGEAYFFKAMDYYTKMYALGEVPWIVAELNIDSPELYNPRTPRAELADSIVKCLDFAIEHLNEGSAAYGIINKDMALFLKARFCLFEGTFRKYHKLGLDDTKFLTLAAETSKKLIDKGAYSLYKDSKNLETSYWKEFTFKADPKADGNTEAIMARVYNGLKLGHSNQRFHEMNNHTRYCMGMPLSLLEEYLCEDGKALYIGGSKGAYTPNPLFKGYDGMWEELENRDPRLLQTVSKPGRNDNDIHTYDLLTGRRGMNEVGIIYPDITYPISASNPLKMMGTTVTGYRFIKHWMGGDLEQRTAHEKGSQTAVIFRYGELLLIYAEAKAELGTITQPDIDLTINALRERAGFDFGKYPDAKLKLGSYIADPRLDDIHREKLGYVLTPLIREIRRERRVEMVLEGMRRQDLLRWKAGPLMTVPMRGMKLTNAKLALYKTTREEKLNTATGIKETAFQAVLNKNVFKDDKDFILPYPIATHITNGELKWDDRAYYYPIPKKELLLNKNLTQNPGWEDPR